MTDLTPGPRDELTIALGARRLGKRELTFVTV